MRIDFTLDLDDPGLQPFREAWRQACERRRGAPMDKLAARALAVHAAIPDGTPTACRDRLAAIPALAALLTAPGWPLPEDERRALVGALSYFCEPLDLIPDEQPRFGLLDDVIVLEMALAACEASWRDWCEYRAWRLAFPAAGPLDRAQWQRTRDALLHDALRRSRLTSYLEPPARERFVAVGSALDFPEATQFGLH